MNEKIAVILVNYNGRKYNDNCIASLLQNITNTKYEVIIVDNASTDDSLKILEESWGDKSVIHILESDQNIGFAKASNMGICWAREHGFTHFFLLNNDTEVETNTIEELIKCYRNHGGIITPKIYYANSKIIWSAGGRFSRFFNKPIQIGLNQMDRGQYNVDKECDFANGCALLFGLTELIQIGLLDETFFLYYEDTEFSMRAAKAEVPIRYCADAIVYHKVNGTTGGNQNPMNAYFISRNWLIFSKMHLGWRYPIFGAYFVLNRLAWMVIWIFQGKTLMLSAVVRGIKDYFVWKRNRELYIDKGPYV